MHDVTALEGRGLPSVGIATTAFVDAAAAQTKSLGFDPAVVFVPHPIQDRTDQEIAAIADQALKTIIEAVTHTA